MLFLWLSPDGRRRLLPLTSRRACRRLVRRLVAARALQQLVKDRQQLGGRRIGVVLLAK